MIETLKSKLKSHGYTLDPYYLFFVSWNVLVLSQYTVYFEKENLEFKISFFSIPWNKLSNNLIFLGDIDPLSFFNRFEIDNKTDNIIVNEIYSMSKMIQFLEKAARFDTSFENGFLQIGYLEAPMNSRLMYSLRQEDCGSIWLEFPDESFLVCLSDNIISFLGNGILNIKEGNITRFGGSIDRLYKNWGEDFWRIREEKEDTI